MSSVARSQEACLEFHRAVVELRAARGLGQSQVAVLERKSVVERKYRALEVSLEEMHADLCSIELQALEIMDVVRSGVSS
jgi:hypothetical protein